MTFLLAPDELVRATISIDRTDEALADDPKPFATQTMKLIPGYEKQLQPSKAESFEHEYQGAIVEAKGVSKKTGVAQNVQVIVLERKGAAIVTAVIAENTEEDAGGEAKQALEAIRTLRTRPPA